MQARELISDIVPALKTSDTGSKALNWMEFFKISHLPIINNQELLGVISDTDIYDHNMSEEAIGSHRLSLMKPFVYENQHIYEIIDVFARLKMTILPVLSREKTYEGVITLQDIVAYFSELAAVDSPGAIIVLQMATHDYSLTQIAQIVESNDTKILSLYTKTLENSTKLEVTLKLNKIDITNVIRTFERYDYTIKNSFMENDTLDQMYQNRYDEFMNYLNI